MRKNVTSHNKNEIDLIETGLRKNGKRPVRSENDVTINTYYRRETAHSDPYKFEGQPSFTIIWEEPD